MKIPAFTIILCAPVFASLALGGGVLKIDDTSITGDIIAFDGTVLTIQTKESNEDEETGENSRMVRQSVALEDIVHVHLSGGTPTTAPAAPPDADASAASEATSRQRAMVAEAIRRLSLLFTSPPSGKTETADDKPAAEGIKPTTQAIALSDAWHVKLSNGDVLSGTLRSWSEQRIALHLQTGGSSITLDIPTEHVVELWRMTPEQARKARRAPIEGAGEGAGSSEGEDVAYVLKDGDVVTVRGLALGIGGAGRLTFRHEGADRQINLARLAGVVLVPQRGAGGSVTNQTRFHQVFRLADGQVLSGMWIALRDEKVSLKTSWDQMVELPRAGVTRIECRNGRVVYLSDLEPMFVEQTPYFDRVIPWRRDSGLGGGKLVLVDGPYDRGVAMHSRCVLKYDLGGQFERFRARLGFEHPAGATGRAAVRIVADDRAPLYDNPDARGDEPPLDLDLDVSGVNRLVLEVDFGRDQDVGDRVIFARARLLRASVQR